MTAIWYILAAFVFRATFGVALSMAITSPRIVDSGFFRVHLWVLMGANTLAALLTYTGHPEDAASAMDYRWLVGLGASLAIVSYVGAVLWLYERHGAGRIALVIISLGGLLAGNIS